MERQADLLLDRRLRTTMLYLARLLAGATQHQLARAAGIKVETLSGYERGLRSPRIAAATRLAVELDLPLELIGQEVELVPLDLPRHMSTTPGQVVAVVRIAPTAPTSEGAMTDPVEALANGAAICAAGRAPPSR
jgi:transcriptional regulator with XRE-family HTH domain